HIADRARTDAQRSLAELQHLDPGGGSAQRVDLAYQQLDADLTHLAELLSAERTAEAFVWKTSRVDPSYSALLSATSDATAVSTSAAHRLDLVATIGSIG